MIDLPLTDKEAKDTQRKLRTASLFFETNATSYPAYFTTKDHNHIVDGVEYMSLKALYLEIGDITEYQFAIQVFGRLKTWQRICDNLSFKAMIDEWREELEIKTRSEAIAAIKETASTEGAKGYTAAKYLADKGWEGKKTKRGKPSKEETVRERKIAAALTTDMSEDAKRLGIARH